MGDGNFLGILVVSVLGALLFTCLYVMVGAIVYDWLRGASGDRFSRWYADRSGATERAALWLGWPVYVGLFLVGRL